VFKTQGTAFSDIFLGPQIKKGDKKKIKKGVKYLF